jgi:hypothetical protein
MHAGFTVIRRVSRESVEREVAPGVPFVDSVHHGANGVPESKSVVGMVAGDLPDWRGGSDRDDGFTPSSGLMDRMGLRVLIPATLPFFIAFMVGRGALFRFNGNRLARLKRLQGHQNTSGLEDLLPKSKLLKISRDTLRNTLMLHWKIENGVE